MDEKDSPISCCLLIIPPHRVSTCPYSCPRNLPRCTKLGLHSAWSRIPRNSFLVLSITRSTRDCNGIFLRRRDPSLWENCSRRRGDEGYPLVSSLLGVSPVDYPAHQNEFRVQLMMKEYCLKKKSNSIILFKKELRYSCIFWFVSKYIITYTAFPVKIIFSSIRFFALKIQNIAFCKN